MKPVNENDQEGFPQAATTEPSEAMTFWERIIGVFGSPGKTFRDIAERPTWVFPFILMILATAIMTQVLIPAIQADYTSSEQYDKLLSNDKLTPEQIESAQKMYLSYVKNFSAISSGIYTAIASVLATAVLLFAGNVILGGNAKFRQIFSIYCWGGLVGLLGLLIRIALSLQKMSMKVYLSPAILFPSDAEETTLFKIAGALDVFLVWRIVLLAIGFAAVYKIAFGKSLATLGPVYAVFVAIGILFSNLF